LYGPAQDLNTQTEISFLQNQLEDLRKKIGDIFQQDVKFYEAKRIASRNKILKEENSGTEKK
jgi:hypothetical protein